MNFKKKKIQSKLHVRISAIVAFYILATNKHSLVLHENNQTWENEVPVSVAQFFTKLWC